MAEHNQLWCRLDQVHRKALTHVIHRKNGVIKSVKTPWPKVNKITAGGFEWNSIITLAGISGTGKTTILNEFTRKAFELNPDENFCVLDFQFEMTHEATGIREFSSMTGRTYHDLLSADKPLDETSLRKISDYVDKQQTRDIYQVDIALTVPQIKKTIEEFCNFKQGKKVIVTIDHSILIKKDGLEQNNFETLYNLGEMMTELKKRLPVMFIVLTQMNRSIEEDNRKKPGTVGNYPTRSDVFGGDALYQHSDIVIAISIPSLMYIPVYGPMKYMVNDDTLVLHFLKMRNGEPMNIFFREEFRHQRIVEVPPPATAGSGRLPASITGTTGSPSPTSFIETN